MVFKGLGELISGETQTGLAEEEELARAWKGVREREGKSGMVGGTRR